LLRIRISDFGFYHGTTQFLPGRGDGFEGVVEQVTHMATFKPVRALISL